VVEVSFELLTTIRMLSIEQARRFAERPRRTLLPRHDRHRMLVARVLTEGSPQSFAGSSGPFSCLATRQPDHSWLPVGQ